MNTYLVLGLLVLFVAWRRGWLDQILKQPQATQTQGGVMQTLVAELKQMDDEKAVAAKLDQLRSALNKQ